VKDRLAPSLDPELVDSEIQAILSELGKTAAWSLYMGPHLDELASALQTRFCRQHVQLCCSGTLAVELALRGCRLGEGDEVLLSAYDFPGNFRAIEAIGATVAIVDIPADAWSLRDIEAIDRACLPNTKAILVSHLHGTVAAMAALCDWAQSRKIYLIEDACQAPGATVDGKPAGAWGDCSILSFGGSKLLSAGRGGAVMTNDAQIDQRMRIFRERGNDAFAMSELQSAVLGPQLRKLDKRHEQRAMAVEKTEAHVSSLRWIALPVRGESIANCAFYKWGFRVQHSVSTAMELRDVVIQKLNQFGVLAGVGFHGFAHRSTKRCRSIGSLSHAVHAAEATVLIHHTALNSMLVDHFKELDRQLLDANLIDE
jgi:perosamine synthetase